MLMLMSEGGSGGGGGQGGGSGGQGGGAGGGGAPAALPWSDAVPTWAVGEKPWYDMLPDGPAKQLISEKKYANPAILANSYYELNRTASARDPANMIQIPGENATDQDLNQFYTKLGRPENVEGYKDVNWGENPDERMVGFAKELAFELGLDPKRAERLAVKWNDFAGKLEKEASDAAAATEETARTALKADWKGGDFDANLAAGNRVFEAMKKNGLSETDVAALEANIGAVPVIKFLAILGKLTGEASFQQGVSSLVNDPANMTPEQAASEIKRLQGDTDFQKSYNDSKHPQHKENVERMSNLFVKAGDKFQV